MRVDKFNQGDTTRTIAHDLRLRMTVTESNIDYSRSNENVVLVQFDQAFYNDVCNLVKRKDAIVSGSVILTLPEELKYESKATQINFFKTALEGIEKHWGGKPLSAVIHYDETTPHLHYKFAPITNDGRLCAKEVIKRQKFITFHTAIEKHLQMNGFNVALQEQDEEQRKINHDLGISTKSLRKFKNEAIDENTQVIEQEILNLQKELKRNVQNVMRHKGESRAEYKERKNNYVEVRRDDYEALLKIKVDLDVQEMKARENVRIAQQNEAIKQLNEHVTQTQEAYKLLKQKEQQYENKLNLAVTQARQEEQQLAHDTAENIRRSLIKSVSENLYLSLPHNTAQEQTSACTRTCNVVGEENVYKYHTDFRADIKQAFSHHFEFAQQIEKFQQKINEPKISRGLRPHF